MLNSRYRDLAPYLLQDIAFFYGVDAENPDAIAFANLLEKSVFTGAQHAAEALFENNPDHEASEVFAFMKERATRYHTHRSTLEALTHLVLFEYMDTNFQDEVHQSHYHSLVFAIAEDNEHAIEQAKRDIQASNIDRGLPAETPSSYFLNGLADFLTEKNQACETVRSWLP